MKLRCPTCKRNPRYINVIVTGYSRTDVHLISHAHCKRGHVWQLARVEVPAGGDSGILDILNRDADTDDEATTAV